MAFPLLFPCHKSGLGHALPEAALLKKSSLQSFELLVKEEVRLVDQADGYIGNYFGGAGFGECSKSLEGERSVPANLADVLCLAAILVLGVEVAGGEVIPVIFQQFF